MSTLELKELSHPEGEVLKMAAGKTLDLETQGTVLLPPIPTSKMPSGSVINVYEQSLPSSGIATTSSSFVDTGLTITLTPVSASSRFYITYTSAVHLNTNNSTVYGLHFVHRGSAVTTIGGGDRQDGSSGWRTGTQTTQGVDSPNTTSAITYTVKILTGSAGNNFDFHVGSHLKASHAAGVACQFTILEIKG